MPDRVEDRTPAVLRAMTNGALLGVQKAADTVIERAIQIHNQKRKRAGGKVEDQIEAGQARRTRRGVACEFGSYHEASASLEYGSAGRGEPDAPGKKRWRPYKIRPKPPRKFLRWTDPETGEEVFRREVTHPGIYPQPYMRPAIAETPFAKIIAESIQGELSKALGRR